MIRYSLGLVVFICLIFPVQPAVTADDSIVGAQLPPISLPNAGGKGAGFRCEIVIGDVQSAGYVPMEITLRSVGTFTADRSFVIRVETDDDGQSPRGNGLVIDLPIMAKQGDKVVRVKRYLPKWSAGYAAKISITEDGSRLTDYQTVVGNRLPQNAFRYEQLELGEKSLNWIFISDQDKVDAAAMPDIRPVMKHVSAAQFQYDTSFPSQTENLQFWKDLINQNWMSAIGQSELPTDWRAYDQHDAVLIGPQALEKLRANAAAFSALRDWLLVGGTVVLYEATTPEETMKAISGSWAADSEAQMEMARLVQDQVRENKSRSDAHRQGIKAMDLFIEAKSNPPMSAERAKDTKNAVDSSEGFATDPIGMTEADFADDTGTDTGTDMDASMNMDASMGGDSAMVWDGAMGMESGFGMQAMGRNPSGMQSPFKFNGKDYFFPANVKDARLQREEMIQIASQIGEDTVPGLSTENPDVFAQAVGAGLVIGTTASVDDPLDSLHWKAIGSMIASRMSPMLRRGVDPMMGDRRFDRWMIPGVAQPPVYTFMGLLVGFVVLVGPVAYRKTSKSGRSYLMFAIAPVLALMTTAAMFAYGIMSDGFGTVTRIRQLTFVDGASGDGGERFRATYFAGVRPSDGLTFPPDAQVMPYPEGGFKSWREHYLEPFEIMGNLAISDQAQRFDSSFLPSRTQRQFVVHLPRRNIGHVALVPATASEPAKIESTLDFPLQSILLRDGAGEYWNVESLAAKSASTATLVDVKKASKMIGKMYNDYRPISATRQSGASRRNYSTEVYDLVNDVTTSTTSLNMITDGVFEQSLQQQLQSSGELPKGHFIATADPSDDVVSVEGAEVVDSVRYLYGTLR